MPKKYQDVIAKNMTYDEKIKEEVDSEVMETLEELRIKQLEEQVRHAEEHGGQTDTAHHEMLRRAKGAPKKDEKEITNG